MAQTIHHLSEVWVQYKALPTFIKGMRRLNIEVKVQQRLPPRYGASLPTEPFSTSGRRNHEIYNS
jgi:hypothetical protein